MPLHIQRAEIRAQRYTRGRILGAPRLIVLHATAGHWPHDRGWIQSGAAPISYHYLISPAGGIVQFVDDADTAWHTGASRWVVDGTTRDGSARGVARLNWLSIGVAFSHINRANSVHTPAQLDAGVLLCRTLAARYTIPYHQLVRHADIAPGRKTDPIALPWPDYRERIYAA